MMTSTYGSKLEHSSCNCSSVSASLSTSMEGSLDSKYDGRAYAKLTLEKFIAGCGGEKMALSQQVGATDREDERNESVVIGNGRAEGQFSSACSEQCFGSSRNAMCSRISVKGISDARSSDANTYRGG